ncbi:MAG: acetoacetate decarboxylase family protein [Acidobacteria bacterium]|nr:acetoacetate decarboxylase family protein [Acidobacteriota bacterium]
MMKRYTLLIIVVCICAILAVSLPGCKTADKDMKTSQADFIPSPAFSPPYPPLPHHFNDAHGLQILCQAPKGAIQRALVPPLERNGNDDLFVLQMGWSPDCEGFNVHEIQINAPVKWKDSVGATTLIEYIDSDMGLIAGREIWGWPKKMADITWTQTDTGWTVECYKQKDQGGIPLMKVEYTISESTPDIEWPVIMPTYLVKRIPNASPKVPPLTQLVCVGCDLPAGGAPVPDPTAVTTETKGTAAVQFFDGPHDPLTFFGPIKVLDAKMSITKGPMSGGLGLGEVVSQWEE